MQVRIFDEAVGLGVEGDSASSRFDVTSRHRSTCAGCVDCAPITGSVRRKKKVWPLLGAGDIDTTPGGGANRNASAQQYHQTIPRGQSDARGHNNITYDANDTHRTRPGRVSG